MKTLIINNPVEKDFVLDQSIDILYWYIEQPLPKLGDCLQYLYADKVKDLPIDLPVNLKTLSCNSVKNIFSLPNMLITLSCDSAAYLPKLPSTLRNLVCNGLSKINSELPDGLELLICDSVKHELPKLPDTINTLSCMGVARLPNVPDNLRTIFCKSKKQILDYLRNYDVTIFSNVKIVLMSEQ